MDVKGIITKRLSLFSFEEPLAVGTELSFKDKVVGTLTSVTSAQGKNFGLAVVKKRAWGETLSTASCSVHPYTE